MTDKETVEGSPGWFAESGEYTAEDLAQFKDLDPDGKVLVIRNRPRVTDAV